MVKFIAELCQNHLGRFDVIKRLVERCAEQGADIVKLQNIFAKDLAFRFEFEKGFKLNKKILCIKRPYKQEYNRLKKLEVSYKNLERFINICEINKVKPSITCFSRNRINELKNIGFKIIKVASYDCGSFQMIEELSKNFKNIIVSTGASYDDEIQKTALILKKNNVNFSFLHCVTVYPTPINLINLNRISYLKKFTNNVGFSDHSLADKKNDNLAIYLAIYFGAKIIERHVRFYDIDKTKDGKVSILPEDIFDIKEFCKLSKKNQIKFLKSKKINLEKIKGDSKRNLTHIELLNRNYYRGRFATIKKNRTIFNWEISKI